MELMRVKAEDVFPSEENPRRDFGDLNALAGSFDLNPMHAGEPLTPPLLVRDGQIYRIVDGERRYRAMGIAGTKVFDAIVCDDWEDAEVALAMLTTDDKKSLTEMERSRGVQRALLLGVDPEDVEQVVRKKGMRRVKRATEIVGVEAECMSLDHLLAVAEFEGDEERSARIAAANENTWEGVAKECRREASNDRAMEKLRAKARELGITLLDTRPDDDELTYEATCRTSDDLEAVHADLGDGVAAYVAKVDVYDGARIVTYSMAGDQVDAEEDAARELAEALAKTAGDAFTSMRDYLVGALMDAPYPSASMRAAVEDWLEPCNAVYGPFIRASEWVDGISWDGPRPSGHVTGMAGVYVLRRWLESARVQSNVFMYVTGSIDTIPQWARNNACAFLGAAAAAECDGWEPGLACKDIMGQLGTWLERTDKEDTETEEEE